MRSSVLKAVTSSWNTNGDIRKVISLTCPLLMEVSEYVDIRGCNKVFPLHSVIKQFHVYYNLGQVYRFQCYFAINHNYENIPMRISCISRKSLQILYI